MYKITLFALVTLIACGNISGEKNATQSNSPKNYSARHKEALAFCKEKKFCTDYYFLLDLGLHSGRNRFFVYSFKQKKVVEQNLVTHGACDVFEPNDTPYEKARFSNRIDSHCSAFGKYKVSSRDYSSWGIHVKYWLDGLEEGNTNARSRVIVLHSWDAVPDAEVYPDYAPLSWGCPAVSNNFMRTLDHRLQATQKPVLLWIVN